MYTYIDAYGEQQESKYNWGGERNFIEHMNNHFDSSYSCVALEVTNYAYHGGHISHSRFNDPGFFFCYFLLKLGFFQITSFIRQPAINSITNMVVCFATHLR